MNYCESLILILAAEMCFDNWIDNKRDFITDGPWSNHICEGAD
jgi:hypothetical protein